MNTINENKEDRLKRRADRKKKRAEKLLDKSKNLEEKSEEWDTSKDFDIVAKKLGKRVKITDFDFIKKLKIKGDEISKDEITKFLNGCYKFIDKYWNKILTNVQPDTFTYDGMEFKVNNNGFGLSLKYKESRKDNIKLKIDKEDLKDSKKEDILKEIKKIAEYDKLYTEVSKLQKKKEETIEKPDEKIEKEKEDKIEKIADKTEKEIIEKVRYDNTFVNQAVNLLKEEGLYKGGLTSLNDVNEDKIFDFFVKEYPEKTLSYQNMDEICELYKRQTMNESWYSGINRATQNLIVGKDPEGIVKDMMFAFNTDKEKLNRDISEILRKKKVHIKHMLKEEADEYERVNESKTKKGLLLKAASLLGKKSKNKTVSKMLSTVGKASGKRIVGKAVKSIGKTGIRLVSKALGAIPLVGWIALGVVEGAFWWYKLDSQQEQIARIFILMFASGSDNFKTEFKAAGLKMPIFMIEEL